MKFRGPLDSSSSRARWTPKAPSTQSPSLCGCGVCAGCTCCPGGGITCGPVGACGCAACAGGTTCGCTTCGCTICGCAICGCAICGCAIGCACGICCGICGCPIGCGCICAGACSAAASMYCGTVPSTRHLEHCSPVDLKRQGLSLQEPRVRGYFHKSGCTPKSQQKPCYTT